MKKGRKEGRERERARGLTFVVGGQLYNQRAKHAVHLLAVHVGFKETARFVEQQLVWVCFEGSTGQLS